MSAEVNLNFVLSLARPAEGQGPLLSWRGLPGQYQLESGSLEAVAKDSELEPPGFVGKADQNTMVYGQ